MSATVLDLFAGPGGWSQACDALGLDELGVEIEPATCLTATTAGHRRVVADVRHYAPGFVPDGLIASPPCQTFSTAGTGAGRRALEAVLAAVPRVAAGIPIPRALGRPRVDPGAPDGGLLFGQPDEIDSRTALVLEPMRYARLLRPRWIALEQVPSVLPVWRAYAQVLSAMGYRVATGVLRAEQYGVPQTRRRAVLLARLDAPVLWPAATHSRFYPDEPKRLDPGVLPWLSMADALGWEPDALVGFARRADRDDGAITLDGIDYRARDLRPAAHPAQAVTEKARSWRVNDQSGTPRVPDWPWRRPATTVAGRDLITDPGTNANRFNGATKSRNDGIRVTESEAGILQSFPADYPWQGSRNERFQQIGDAMPPKMAQAALAVLL